MVQSDASGSIRLCTHRELIIVAVFAAAAIIILGVVFSLDIQQRHIAELILENELETKRVFSSKSEWALDEWATVRNEHLEVYYNLLLMYNDDTITTLVKLQEFCLKELVALKDVNASTQVVSEKIDRCNHIGEAIELALLAHLQKQ